MHKKTAKTYVCLDVGAHSIKVLEVSLGHGRPEVLNWAVEEMDSDLEHLSYAGLAGTIKGIMEKAGITARSLLVVERGRSILVRVLRLPAISDRELEDTVAFELKKDLPFPIEETYYRFMKLGELPNDRIEVLATVIRKEVMNDISRLAEGLDMNLAGVYPSCLCLNALVYERLKREPEPTLSGIIEIGHNLSGISFLKNRHLRFSKDISYASLHLTREVAKSIAPQAAEPEEFMEQAAKESRRVGLLDDRDVKRLMLVDSESPDLVVGKSIKTVVGKLLQKLRLAHGIYKSQTGEVAMDRVFIFGGGACLRNIGSAFAHGFGTTIEEFGPADAVNININDEFKAHQFKRNDRLFASLAGLAVVYGSNERFFRVFNLVPEELRPSLKRDALRQADKLLGRKVFYIGVAAAFIVVSGLQFWLAGRKTAKLSKVLHQGERKNSRLGDRLSAFTAMKRRNETLAHKVAFMDRVESDYVPWSWVLRELARSAPEGVIVEEFLALEDNSFRLNGRVKGLELCAPFIEELSAIDCFENVEQKRCFRDPSGDVYRFSFEGTIRRGQADAATGKEG